MEKQENHYRTSLACELSSYQSKNKVFFSNERKVSRILAHLSNMNIMLLAQHLPQVTAAATKSRESLHQWLGPRNNYEKEGSGPGKYVRRSTISNGVK